MKAITKGRRIKIRLNSNESAEIEVNEYGICGVMISNEIEQA